MPALLEATAAVVRCIIMRFFALAEVIAVHITNHLYTDSYGIVFAPSVSSYERSTAASTTSLLYDIPGASTLLRLIRRPFRYDRLRASLLVRKPARHLRMYLELYFSCRLHETTRHTLCGELRSITRNPVHYRAVGVDFVTTLPETTTGVDVTAATLHALAATQAASLVVHTMGLGETQEVAPPECAAFLLRARLRRPQGPLAASEDQAIDTRSVPSSLCAGSTDAAARITQLDAQDKARAGRF